MDNAYRWSPAATPAVREVPTDVASVAQMWVAATYDDLRPGRSSRGLGPGGPRSLCDSLVRPARTNSVGDITYFMVHEWLLTLVGRQRSEPDDHPPPPEVIGAPRTYRDLYSRGGRGGRGQRGHGSTPLA